MFVYVIQTDFGLDTELENSYATLHKEVAKQIIKDEILDHNCDEELTEQEVEEFAQDMVDGKTKNHYSDEFEGIHIWCDRLPLQEE